MQPSDIRLLLIAYLLLEKVYNKNIKINISLKIKIKAFLTILKDLALNYYSSNISISSTIINYDKINILI